MASWKIGQKLVCIKKGLWYHFDTCQLTPSYGPKYGEICEIISITDLNGLVLKGYEDNTNGYNQISFRPLLGESAKSELVSSFKEVTETSDCPIPQTETA